jgi:hypothetical protein
MPSFGQAGIGKVCPEKGGEIVSIRWSALKVAEAMDEVEALLNEAEPILAEAEQKASQARDTPNLPEYTQERLGRLRFTIEHRQALRLAIANVRKSIPEGAVEAEQERGNQQGLEL